MADYYNAYHAVWKNRYENELVKNDNIIKPINSNSVSRAQTYLHKYESEKQNQSGLNLDYHYKNRKSAIQEKKV